MILPGRTYSKSVTSHQHQQDEMHNLALKDTDCRDDVQWSLSGLRSDQMPNIARCDELFLRYFANSCHACTGTPSGPYCESSLVDPDTGRLIPVFNLAIKKMSDYGVDDGFGDKVKSCGNPYLKGMV